MNCNLAANGIYYTMLCIKKAMVQFTRLHKAQTKTRKYGKNANALQREAARATPAPSML